MTERDIFLAVLDLPDPAVRAAYLDAACGGNAARRARVEALIRSHDAAGSFLAEPAVVAPDLGQAATRTFATDPAADANPIAGEPLDFLAPPQRPDSLGRIGHYEVLEVLGRGGFGIVFRAFDDVLQRVVAVKVLFPTMAATSPARKRFLREARSSAQIRHENVVQVYAVEEQPLPYLVMEFIPGETLQQRLDRTGPLDVPEVLRIGRQVAEGLAAAHAQGLIHRDIKPANVMIEGDGQRVKLTDFGLARAADDASISQSGVVAGTPMYMAPEQATGESLDHRADLFSLGSVLYVMASGRPPFRASTTLAVLKRVAEEDPRPIREVIPEVPEWLCRVIEKLHAKNPDERFQTAKEVADLLGKYLAEWEASGSVSPPAFARPTPARPTGDRPRKPWILRRWKAVVAALLVVGVAWRCGPHLVLMARDRAEVRFAAEDVPGAQLVLSGNGQQNVLEHRGGLAILEVLPGTYQVELRPVPGKRFTSVRYHHQTLLTGEYVPNYSAHLPEIHLGRGDRFTLVGSMTTMSSAPAADRSMPPTGASLPALRQLVAAKEREREMAKARFDAGRDNALDMLAAEVELTTARIRLAEAEQDAPARVARLQDLVTQRQDERKLIAIKVEVGVATPDALDQADGRLADAQARLAQARLAAPIDAAGSDRAKIQGTWTGVSADREGQSLPALVLKAIGPTVIFDGDKVTWRANPAPEVKDVFGRLLADFRLEGVFHVDPTKSPKTIDLTVLGPNAKTPIGTPAPRALLGIYRLDGDSLEICIAIDPDHAEERPTQFESVPGKLISHMKLRRQPP